MEGKEHSHTEPAKSENEAAVEIPVKDLSANGEKAETRPNEKQRSPRSPNRTLVVSLVILIVILLAALGGGWYFLLGPESGSVKIAPKPKPGMKPVPTTSFRGKITDLVDGRPVTSALISAGEKTTASQEGGEFLLYGIASQEFTATFEKNGYLLFKAGYRQSEEDHLIKLVPEGKVIFVSNRDGDRAIYTANFDGSLSEKLVQNKSGYDDYSPQLSPDKKHLAFYSTRNGERDDYGNLKPTLYLFNLETRATPSELIDESGIGSVSWLEDSSGLIYFRSHYSSNEPTSHDIKLVSLNGKKKTLISNDHFEPYEYKSYAYLSQPVLSKDSKRIAFSVNHWNHKDNEGIYAMMTTGGEPWRVSKKKPSSSLEFSEDGNHLEFDVTDDGKKKRLSVSVIDGKEREIPLQDTRYYCPGEHSYPGGGVGGAGGSGYCQLSEILSSDGKTLAFTDFRDGKRDVYTSQPDGTGEKRLTTIGGVGELYWGPRDRYLLFSVSQQNERAIYIVGLQDGNQPLKITDIFGDFAGVVF